MSIESDSKNIKNLVVDKNDINLNFPINNSSSNEIRDISDADLIDSNYNDNTELDGGDEDDSDLSDSDLSSSDNSSEYSNKDVIDYLNEDEEKQFMDYIRSSKGKAAMMVSNYVYFVIYYLFL
jgi:hypothetical protein